MKVESIRLLRIKIPSNDSNFRDTGHHPTRENIDAVILIVKING
jgi:hypothetical protein